MDTSSATADSSLFDRIGGSAAVTSLVDDFYKRVTADPELSPYFKGVAMEKLRRMQFEFFSAALGGPEKYTGRSIVHAHQTHRINLQAFQRFVAHLFATLERYPLSEQERYDIITRINLYTNDVVSAGTGIVG
jgi:hemoglobin